MNGKGPIADLFDKMEIQAEKDIQELKNENKEIDLEIKILEKELSALKEKKKENETICKDLRETKEHIYRYKNT